jgi:hypothetical protein
MNTELIQILKTIEKEISSQVYFFLFWWDRV